MFSGIKDFFSLEKLVFVDNDDDIEINNMFVYEDTGKVFLKEPSEVRAKYFT